MAQSFPTHKIHARPSLVQSSHVSPRIHPPPSKMLAIAPRAPAPLLTLFRYKDATYELPGPASNEKGAESVKQTAAKIIAYFQANNYKIKEAGETIT